MGLESLHFSGSTESFPKYLLKYLVGILLITLLKYSLRGVLVVLKAPWPTISAKYGGLELSCSQSPWNYS